MNRKTHFLLFNTLTFTHFRTHVRITASRLRARHNRHTSEPKKFIVITKTGVNRRAFFYVKNCDASAELQEVCFLEQRVNSLSVLQKPSPESKFHNGSVRPISDESWIHQKPCKKRGRGGYFVDCRVRLPCKSKCLCLFAEATETTLSVSSEPVGVLAVKLSTVRQFSEKCERWDLC